MTLRNPINVTKHQHLNQSLLSIINNEDAEYQLKHLQPHFIF